MKTKCLSILAVCLATALGVGAQTSWDWTNKANLPQAELASGGVRGPGVATLNGKFYTVGGINSPTALRTVLLYDPASDTWTRKADMLSLRVGGAAVAINGKLYAIGGSVGDTPLATMEEYDPVTDTWTNKASLNQARTAFQAVTSGGKIYAIGGTAETVGHDNPLASVEQYDPISNTWTNMADMPTPRLSFGAAVFNGKIYVIGGRILNTLIPEVWEYTPSSNTWAIKAAMPTPREALAAVAVNGRILALGGFSATVEEYNATTDTWTTKPNLPISRNECFAVLLDSAPNTLYVFGGYSDFTMIALNVSSLLNIYTSIELEFFTQTNRIYQLQSSPDLISWTNIDPTFQGNDDYWRKLYSTRSQAKLFYRIHDVTP